MKINVANPSEKSWTNRSFLFVFGAYGCTYVLAYGDSLDDALESAAEWLADNAPGHIMAHDSEELADLHREALTGVMAEELCEMAGIPCEKSYCSDPDDRAFEQATADLTYTESGYLTSYEWGIVRENPTRDELIRIYHDRY